MMTTGGLLVHPAGIIVAVFTVVVAIVRVIVLRLLSFEYGWPRGLDTNRAGC